MPQSTIALARLDTGTTHPLTIARVDMIFDGESYRAIECNADTPAFIVETHRANAIICGEQQALDMNTGAEAQLTQTLLDAVASGVQWRQTLHHEIPHIVFAASGTAMEDMATAHYLQTLVAHMPGVTTRCVPLQELSLEYDRLLDDRGLPVDVLYRLWPIENFAYDQDLVTGDLLGPDFFRLVRDRKLAIINPPSGYAYE